MKIILKLHHTGIVQFHYNICRWIRNIKTIKMNIHDHRKLLKEYMIHKSSRSHWLSSLEEEMEPLVCFKYHTIIVKWKYQKIQQQCIFTTNTPLCSKINNIGAKLTGIPSYYFIIILLYIVKPTSKPVCHFSAYLFIFDAIHIVVMVVSLNYLLP